MKESVNALILVSTIALFTISCKDEPAPVSLIGTWILSSTIVSNCDDPIDNSTDTCTTNCEWVFTETRITFEIISLPFAYTTDANTLFIHFTNNLIVEYNYFISGSTLTLTTMDNPSVGCLSVSTFTRKG